MNSARLGGFRRFAESLEFAERGVEFKISSRGVQEDRVALVGNVEVRRLHLILGGAHEVALGKVQQRLLRGNIKKRGRASRQRRRDSSGISQPRSEYDGGQIGRARLLVGIAGLPLVGGRDDKQAAVFQRQVKSLAKREQVQPCRAG